MTINRRQGLLWFGACALTATAEKAANAAEPRRYAVLSLVGDQIDIAYAGFEVGTHIDPNQHRLMPDPGGTFDGYALAAIGKALAVDAGPGHVDLLSLPPSPLHQQADRLFEGTKLALPGSVVGSLNQFRDTHVVLLTKHRGEASLPLLHSHIGIGHLEGLGYYVDREPRIRMVESGAVAHGLLAPYFYAQLTLADAISGEVLHQRIIHVARVYPLAESKTAVDPWDVLDPQQKVTRLRRLMDLALAREVPLLLQAA